MSKKAWIIAGLVLLLGVGTLLVLAAGGIGLYFYKQREPQAATSALPPSTPPRAAEPSTAGGQLPTAETESGKADSVIDDIEPDPVRDPNALDAPLLGGGAPSKATPAPRRLTEAPEKLKNVDPVYPDIAKSARVQGVVILEVTVGPTGRVTSTTVLRSIPLLDAAAIDAVKQWQYTPTLLNGRPMPVIITVTVNFTLR